MHEAEVGLTSLGLMPQESPDFSPGRRSTIYPVDLDSLISLREVHL